MLKNYFKIAMRIVRRHKGYSFIKISGLAIGMAVCILILLFVRYELSFDTFHEKKDRIYRVLSELDLTEGSEIVPLTALPLAPAVKDDFDVIIKAARFSGGGRVLFRSGEKKFFERLYFVDADAMEIFTFPLKAGDARQALADPFSVLITEKIAKKYFGDENPLGKTITIRNAADYRVTGILEEIPGNSHLRFDALASLSSLNNTERLRGNYWDRFSNDYTYILLEEEADPQAVESQFPSFMAKHVPVEADRYGLHLQSLKDIHFSSLNYDVARRINKEYLYAYSAIAFFILIIACINFMNLATARSAGRAREVGIRKVVGAHRRQLIHQFFSESVLTALLSLAAAIGLVVLSLPLFNQFIQENLAFDLWHDWILVISLLGLCVFVGLVSGSYPALVLSSFKPVKVLKNTLYKGKKGLSFRTVSIVMQFAISIILIIATAVVFAQLHFMRNKDLGFDAEQVLVIQTRSDPPRDKIEAFKNEITRNPFISIATASFGTPASGAGSGRTFIPEGFPEGETLHLETLFVDYEFIQTFGLKLEQGRNFSRNFSTDVQEAFILNETAARKLGWDDPIGKRLELEDTEIKGKVIGVVKDFHYDSVEYAIAPMVLTLLPFQISFVSARVQMDQLPQTLAFLESNWKEFSPEYPFEYFFINEEFEIYYNFERRLGNLFTYCSILALLISCMGIFGLASFTAEQRTKEIGIRKVLGASVQGIIYLLSKGFVKWVLVANIIAWPLAYFVMNKWLANFAYRINIGLWIFALSGILTLLIALLTVGYQSVKTAFANPIDSLRYE